MNWNEIWNNIVNFLQTTGLRILLAIAILVLGVLLVRFVVKLTKKALAKSTMEKIVQGFLCSFIKVAMYVLLIYWAAQVIGLNTSGFLAIISAAGLAISLALQNSLSNLTNGIVLLVSHPFSEGDFVSIDGTEGTVKEIQMTHTILISIDNKVLSIPNSAVVSSTIVNYNVLGKRKIIFNFDVDYASDVSQVKKIILDVMYSDGRIKLDPAPFCALKILGESNLTFVANCWVDSEDYWDVFYYVTDKVFNEFKRNNINIAYNQMEVRLRNDVVVSPIDAEPLPQRVDKPEKIKEPTDLFEKAFFKNKQHQKAKKQQKEKKRAQKLAQKQAKIQQKNAKKQLAENKNDGTDNK